MSQAASNELATVQPYAFRSFGVTVEIASNHQDIVDRAAAVARDSMLNQIVKLESGPFALHFDLTLTKSGTYSMRQNGKRLSSGRSARKFFKFFDSILRAAIGEYSSEKIFMHAGAVGWKGKAIILPADSFRGKSTLVTELIKCGAVYYSDEFALFDQKGLVHPFPRNISRRTEDYKAYEITLDDLNATVGTKPIPVGTVLFTEYAVGARWSPKRLTAGQGILEMIPFVLSFSQNPKLSLTVLKNVASRATIISGRRGSAEKFAKTLLNFVDKHVN